MTPLPTIPFGKHRLSRLLIGDNPIYGYSHFNQLLSRHQSGFHTPEQVVATLKRCEEVGVNGWQNTLTERSRSDLRRYREQGGTVQWLCLSTGRWYDEPELVADAAQDNPIGIAPHGGGVGDRCLREGKLGHLRDILKRIRDTGTMVGLSTHDPQLLYIAEEENWDLDYYMTALYNLRGGRESFVAKFGYEPLGEVYLREDRDKMLAAMRSTSKPCLAFKVLAAGRAVGSREMVRAEFTYALRNMKRNDALLIGMYQQFGDQIGENAELVASICDELGSSTA
jgi:hypothetical protein